MTPFAQGSLDPAGPVAETIADLWWLMLALGVAVFVVFLALLALGLFGRARDGEADVAALSRRWVVGGGVVMPVVVLAAVFGATVHAMRAMPTAASADALVVEIVGHQWWWEVHYPKEGVTVTNELHIPVGRPVALNVSSADVIHSFWVPELGGKIDLLPDRPNTLVLEADRAGEFHSQCAEFCGMHHADMKLRVVAEPPVAFATWLAAQR